MKIKITKSEREIEGNIQEAVVKPFGTSGHISLGKKHLGKVINIIIPSKPKYCWVLQNNELTELIDVCTKILSKDKESRLKPLLLQSVNNIKNTKFDLNDLIKSVEILKGSPEHQHLIKKIEEIYNLS